MPSGFPPLGFSEGQFQVNEIQKKNTSTQRLKVRLREAKISQDKLYFLQFFLDKEIVKVFSKIFRMRGPLQSSVKSRE